MPARECLTQHQRQWLAEFALRQLQAMNPVRDRLEKILPPADPLMRDVQRAYDAVYALRVSTMYLTMDAGHVGGE